MKWGAAIFSLILLAALVFAISTMVEREQHAQACEAAGGIYLFRGDLCLDPDQIIEIP